MPNGPFVELRITDSAISKYIDELLKYFRKEDSMGLRSLSDEAIEKATFVQEKRLVNISLIAYSLSKLTSKTHILKAEQWSEFKTHIMDDLAGAKPLESVLGEMVSDIAAFDKDLGNYVTDVMEKARIKLASTAYAMGLSMSQAADLCGCDRTELLRYVGATKIHDRSFTQSRSVMDRYGFAKEILGG
jgi:hypothetical protein